MSEINYFKKITLQDDVANDIDQLHVGDINGWMMCQLMIWIACMSRELY
jgi:hypothetical protein